MFSIIIPTYNRLDLVKQAIASVEEQLITDREIIVVDDGSTDGTFEYLCSFGRKIQVFRQENCGPGSARNLAARQAKGEYLAFLDSDDLWFPWTLNIYREVVCAAKPSFIAGKPHIFSGMHDLKAFTAASGTMQVRMFSDYLASGDQWRWWGASSFVVRRDVFSAVGGFLNDWLNGEDADLALRLGDAPGFAQVTEPVTFAYRQHAQSAVKDLSRTLAGARRMIRSEQKGFYPGGRGRMADRRRILTRHLRPVTIECLRERLYREAWQIYVSTFRWNATLARFRYLVGFPVIALLAAFTSRR